MAFVYPEFVGLVEISRFVGKVSAAISAIPSTVAHIQPVVLANVDVSHLVSKIVIMFGADSSVSAVQPLIGLASEAVPLFLAAGLISGALALVGGIEKGIGAVGNFMHGTVGKNSQRAKEAEESKRANAAIKATDPNANAIQKAFWRRRGGYTTGRLPGMGMSDTSRQRLQGAADKAMNNKVASEAVEMEKYNWDTPGIKAMTAAATDSSNKARQIAAIQRLSMTAGGRASLNGVKAALTNPKTGQMDEENFRTWQKGTEKLDRSRAPQLVKGTEKAFTGVSGGEMSKYDPATAALAAQHWTSLANERAGLNLGTAEGQERAATIDRTLGQAHAALYAVNTNDRLKNEMEPDALAALNASFHADPTNTAVGWDPTNAAKFKPIPGGGGGGPAPIPKP